MKPHPDFADLEVPSSFSLGAFQLDMLSAKDLDEDFAAITDSAPVLKGLFGPDWPEGWTREENEIDLHWHHREFLAKRSYAWVIRQDGGYIGCAYLFPEWLTPRSAEAPYWVIDHPNRKALLASFGPLYLDWLRGLFGPDYVLTEISNAAL